VSHIKSFPSHTAPAGYVCPGCSTSVRFSCRSPWIYALLVSLDGEIAYIYFNILRWKELVFQYLMSLIVNRVMWTELNCIQKHDYGHGKTE
jgi:hypothetical protein